RLKPDPAKYNLSALLADTALSDSKDIADYLLRRVQSASAPNTLFGEEPECGDSGDRILFPNARGGSLSTDGATYILQQAVQRALPACPTLKTKKISPHVIRHTTAMHLLQSGVEIAVIALWLGHESLDTTHMYIQADLKTKEQALGKLQPVYGGFLRFKPDG